MRFTSKRNLKRKIHNTVQVNKFTCLEFKSQCVFRGTKRLVSVNIFSVEGNSADIFVSKVYGNEIGM